MTQASSFPDVNEFSIPNSQVRDEIERLAGAGIIAGFPDGTFKPAQVLTVAQAATLVTRTLAFIRAQNDAAPQVLDLGTTAADYDASVSSGLLDRTSTDLYGDVYDTVSSDVAERGLLADVLAHAIQTLVDASVISSRALA